MNTRLFTLAHLSLFTLAIGYINRPDHFEPLSIQTLGRDMPPYLLFTLALFLLFLLATGYAYYHTISSHWHPTSLKVENRNKLRHQSPVHPYF